MTVQELIDDLQKLPHKDAKVLVLFSSEDYKARFKIECISNLEGMSDNREIMNFGGIILKEESGLMLYPDFAKRIADKLANT